VRSSCENWKSGNAWASCIRRPPIGVRPFVWFLAKEQVLNGFSCSCRYLAKPKLARNYLPCLNYQKLFTHNEPNSFPISHFPFPGQSANTLISHFRLLQVPQTGDGFLNFTSIRREHSGWYKCTSRHLNFQYSSIGYYLSVRCEYPRKAGRKLDRVCVKLP